MRERERERVPPPSLSLFSGLVYTSCEKYVFSECSMVKHYLMVSTVLVALVVRP